MAYFWKLPPTGAVKVNIHGATPFMPLQNGNVSGLGMIIRNCEGELLKLSTGTILNLSSIHNQLKAIHHGLLKAFDVEYQRVILKSDNLEAFMILKNFHHGVADDIKETAEHILIMLHDPRWACSIMYVFPGRNKVTIYLARLGGEKCKQVYTFTRPVGEVENLLSLDLGYGSLDSRMVDVVVADEEADPVDFGSPHLAPSPLLHGGYAFQEDFFAIHNEVMDAPEVIPVHEFAVEDYLLDHGKDADEFNGDIMMSY